MNGSGKSTLLKIIGGVEKAESGQIETQKGLQVVYVDQEPSFPPGTKVEDVMFDPKGSPTMAAVREYQLASQGLTEGTDKAYDRWGMLDVWRGLAWMVVSSGFCFAHTCT